MFNVREWGFVWGGAAFNIKLNAVLSREDITYYNTLLYIKSANIVNTNRNDSQVLTLNKLEKLNTK